MMPTQFHRNRTPRFTKTQLKARGWSEELIRLLLHPDQVEINRHNPRGPAMQLFTENAVLVAESDPRFLDHLKALEAKRHRKRK